MSDEQKDQDAPKPSTSGGEASSDRETSQKPAAPEAKPASEAKPAAPGATPPVGEGQPEAKATPSEAKHASPEPKAAPQLPASEGNPPAGAQAEVAARPIPPAAGPQPPDQPGPAAAREAAASPKAAAGSGAPAEGAPARPAAAAAGAAPAEGAPARPARAAAGPSPAELAQRAEVPSNALARLRERYPDIAKSATFFAGVPIVEVPVASLEEVCRFLKEDPQADCKYLSNLHGNHNPDKPKPFEVIYHLYSITTAQWIELKVEVAEGEDVPSVCGVWKTANWHEREAYDLLGIRFAGHPDLKRILLPDDWVGHPLRKEYPLEGKEGDHKLYR